MQTYGGAIRYERSLAIPHKHIGQTLAGLLETDIHPDVNPARVEYECRLSEER